MPIWLYALIGFLTASANLVAMARALSHFTQVPSGRRARSWKRQIALLGILLAANGILLIMLLTGHLANEGAVFSCLLLGSVIVLAMTVHITTGLLQSQDQLQLADRKEAEARISDERDKLQSVIDAIPGFVSWISFDKKYLGANKALLDILGKTHEEIKGMKVGFSGENASFSHFVTKLLDSPNKQLREEIEVSIKGKPVKYWLVGNKFSDTEVIVLGFHKYSDDERRIVDVA